MVDTADLARRQANTRHGQHCVATHRSSHAVDEADFASSVAQTLKVNAFASRELATRT
jgi:hypothetical protein